MLTEHEADLKRRGIKICKLWKVERCGNNGNYCTLIVSAADQEECRQIVQRHFHNPNSTERAFIEELKPANPGRVLEVFAY